MRVLRKKVQIKILKGLQVSGLPSEKEKIAVYKILKEIKSESWKLNMMLPGALEQRAIYQEMKGICQKGKHDCLHFKIFLGMDIIFSDKMYKEILAII